MENARTCWMSLMFCRISTIYCFISKREKQARLQAKRAKYSFCRLPLFSCRLSVAIEVLRVSQLVATYFGYVVLRECRSLAGSEMRVLKTFQCFSSELHQPRSRILHIDQTLFVLLFSLRFTLLYQLHHSQSFHTSTALTPANTS